MSPILFVEGPDGFGVILPNDASDGAELKLINDKDKPMRVGQYWIWPGDEIHIRWYGGRWEATRHFVAIHED